MKAKLLVLAVALVPLAAQADKFNIAGETPAAFQNECASCHLAFPPQLLGASDWRRVMASLDKHYGDNASLDEKSRRSIEEFLVRNAGSPKKVGSGDTAKLSNELALPRLTATSWFQRKHHEVSRTDWTHAKVKTPANCAACHSKAGEGSFREREIVMPNGKKWES